jgi:hypothetical protein
MQVVQATDTATTPNELNNTMENTAQALQRDFSPWKSVHTSLPFYL